MDYFNIALLVVFSVVSLAFGWFYFFGKQRFTPWCLLGAVWSASIAVAQLRLSPLEQQWGVWFWAVIGSFFAFFAGALYLGGKWWKRRVSPHVGEVVVHDGWVMVVLIAMTLAAVAANAYIYSRFGTLPILSTIPDRMRFIINKEIFGLWEYAALLPRIAIPFGVLYLLFSRTKKWWHQVIVIATIVIGFFLLSLYAARLLLIFPILLSYFAYLVVRHNTITFKKMVLATVAAAFLVLSLSVAIPGVRQYITYKDYYEEGGDPFNYIVEISHVNLPKMFSWIVPLYIVPTFNLQALSRSTEFYSWPHYFWGSFELTPFRSLLHVVGINVPEAKVVWGDIFLPWWVTATFLFPYWADFGLIGIIIAGAFWGVFLSGVYLWATRRPHYWSIMLFAYASFVVVMSIYTNYFSREELYLDAVVIAIVGYFVGRRWGRAPEDAPIIIEELTIDEVVVLEGIGVDNVA